MSNFQNDKLSNRLLKHIPGNQITWRNMEIKSNKDSLYRNNNVRYFAIKLDDDFANEMEQEGWPVIWRNVARDDEPEMMKAYLKVFIKYGTRFPIDIYLVNSNGRTKTLLDESDLDNLNIDSKPIEFIDVLIRPYYWTYGDKHGIKAQVEAMNIMLSQSGLDDDYEVVYKD